MSVNRKKISEYVRFSLAQRIEHFVLILSFSLLGLTGLPQKYPLSPISQGVVGLLGGIEALRIIHRVAATVFLIEAIYHVVVVGYKLFVQRRQASMVPTLKDGTDAVQAFQYNLGMRKDAPKMPRYNFTEKAEYWAMIWGLLVMAVTGFMLWNPIATTNLLPGEIIPAAKVAHGGEAVLAVLAIILWHFYHVHIRHFNKSMFTGKMDRHAMEEEHGAELEAVETGAVTAVSASDDGVSQRRTIFVPVAAITSLALLAGVYWFVTFEESAITTLPREQQPQAFVPATPTMAPPTATPKPTQPASEGVVVWAGAMDDMFQTKCGTCHGAIGGFKADTYENVMKAVEPGNPKGSTVYTVQVDGGHPGQFTQQELDLVYAWIAAGAQEESEGGAAAGGQTGADTWASLEPVFQSQCAACHGSTGGFNAESYAEVMKAVTPNDAEGSNLVKVQREGHPGMFQPEDLERIVNWIQAGAPE